MSNLPHIPPGLIEGLQKVFPDILPTDHNTPPSMLGRLVGQQRVIQYLQRIANEQAEASLTGRSA